MFKMKIFKRQRFKKNNVNQIVLDLDIVGQRELYDQILGVIVKVCQLE